MKRVFAHIGFSFALTLIILNFLSINWALAVFAASSVLFAVFLAIPKTRKAVAVPLCMLCVALSALLFSVNYYANYLPQAKLSGESVQAEIYICDVEEVTSSGKYAYTVKSKSISLPDSPQNITFILYADARINSDYYQVIKADVSFFTFADNGYASAGRFADKTFLNAALNTYDCTDEAVFSLNKYVINIRNEIKELFEKEIGGDNGALAAAILTGNKCSLSLKAYNDFKSCGATHLMAVSGLHLSVLAGALYYLLRRILVPEIPRTVLCAAAVFFYIALSGFSKSMIRAGIMLLVLLLSRLFKDKSDSLNSLGFAAFIVCLNPYAVTDAGALLSFSAVLGLITINPYISRPLKVKNVFLKYARDIFTASVSVFITTFPAMFFLFGTVSLVGIFINIVMIPLTQAVLVSSILFIAFSFCLPIMQIFSGVIYYATEAMLKTVGFCSKFAYATVSVNSFYCAAAIAAVFFIFGIGFFIRKNKTLKICAVLSSVIFLSVITASAALTYNDVYVRVIGGEKSNAVVVYDKRNAFVIGVKEYEQFYKASSILSANKLNLLMVVDNNGASYSEKLANRFDAKNYVTSDRKDLKLNKNVNLSSLSDFDVDLWQYVNVKYNSSDFGMDCQLLIYETVFDFNDYNLSSAVQNDIIYTVDENGYSFWGVNEWVE